MRIKACRSLHLVGGADRDRTDDLLNANQALSQLSYSPVLIDRPTEAVQSEQPRRAGL